MPLHLTSRNFKRTALVQVCSLNQKHQTQSYITCIYKSIRKVLVSICRDTDARGKIQQRLRKSNSSRKGRGERREKRLQRKKPACVST